MGPESPSPYPQDLVGTVEWIQHTACMITVILCRSGGGSGKRRFKAEGESRKLNSAWKIWLFCCSEVSYSIFYEALVHTNQTARCHMAEGRATTVGTLHIACELTPWGAFILGKLIVPHLIKKFPTLYRYRKFITLFTGPLHLSLSWDKSITSTPHHRISWRYTLTL